jgi:tRNA pseudouridine55 synthase
MTGPLPPLSPFPLSGLLIIDKPERITSMHVCRIVRGKLVGAGAPKRVKVGHAGTLDPLATGVLVVLVGRSTKLCDRLMAGKKRYVAEIDLAHTSSTDDREGQVAALPNLSPPSLDLVRETCAAFTGTIQQRPPSHSAIWVDGKRAYKLARAAEMGRGEAFELPSRPVDILAIDVLHYQWPRLKLDVRCGKGTYIRSLARDIGAALGVGGMLQELRRTAVGPFMIENAVMPSQLPPTLVQADLLDPAPFLNAP